MTSITTIAPDRLPDVLVLRHGETEWNIAGRLQGPMDSPLTARGQAQAVRQGAILTSLGAGRGWTWLASPQGRAMRTAELARGNQSIEITAEPRLREIGMGTWAGRVRSEIAAEHPDLFAGGGLGWYDHVPEGEGLTALATRLTQVLADLQGPTVIVTHGITSRVLRCVALGLRVSAFEEVGGGQGVVYHLSKGTSTCLTKPVQA